jgi:CBS domain-containing protein
MRIILQQPESTAMPTTAADVMSSPAIVVAPETSVADIAALLASKRISAVPVCGADGALAGLVSEGDILRPFRESIRQKRDWWLGVLAEGEDLPQDFLDYIRRDTRTARDVMTARVTTAEAHATLPELAELMVARGVKRIPIVRDGRVVGIVSRSDVIAAIARAPAMLL